MGQALLCSLLSRHLLLRGMRPPRASRATPQGAHLRKHEHTVRDPHQYDSLNNVRDRPCVFAIELRRRLGLRASYTNVFVDGVLRTEPVRVIGAVDLLTICTPSSRAQERVLHVPVPARSGQHACLLLLL
jgi:hypothetical protein